MARNTLDGKMKIFAPFCLSTEARDDWLTTEVSVKYCEGLLIQIQLKILA